MKILKIAFALLLSFSLANVKAQSDNSDYTKGSVTLANGMVVSGLVKNNIRKNASVILVSDAGKAKSEYDGNSILSAEVNGSKYLCIGGDFFQVVTEGELSFLQKSSDVSGKVVYNGLENMVLPGTEGKPGDYFILNSSTRELSKVSKKNVNVTAASLFAGCAAAIEKAKAVNGDIAQVKDAVDIYNRRNK